MNIYKPKRKREREREGERERWRKERERERESGFSFKLLFLYSFFQAVFAVGRDLEAIVYQYVCVSVHISRTPSG